MHPLAYCKFFFWLFLSPTCHPWKVPGGCLITLFDNMPWCDESNRWDEEADLRNVIRYARGSKRLSIPEGWKAVLPKTTFHPLRPIGGRTCFGFSGWPTQVWPKWQHACGEGAHWAWKSVGADSLGIFFAYTWYVLLLLAMQQLSVAYIQTHIVMFQNSDPQTCYFSIKT